MDNNICSNFLKFDEAIGGYIPGRFIVIAGTALSGKMEFFISLMTALAVNQSVPVELFSLELSNMLVMRKMLSNVFELDRNGQKIGEHDPDEETFQRFQNAPIYIDDTAAISIQSLKERVFESSVTNNVKVVFIDYLQLIKEYRDCPDQVLMGLKQVAEEAKVTIIASSQLKGSGSFPRFLVKDNITSIERIMEYADIVALLERPSNYSYAVYQKLPNLATMCFIKNQNGISNAIDFSYDYRICKFTDYKSDDLISKSPFGYIHK